MYFWFGSTPYGANVGRYYGFNFFGFSFHVRRGGMGNEIALGIGNWLRFWPEAH